MVNARRATSALALLALAVVACDRKSEPTTTSATSSSSTAVAPSADKLIALDLAAHHACAVRANGDVLCWGSSQFLQSGRRAKGEPAIVAVPKPVAGAPKAKSVVTTHAGTCALVGDGSVSCWGMAPIAAPIGDGLFDTAPKREPTPITGLAEITQLAASSSFACGVRRDGKVSCWGDNDEGQLGAGDLSAHEGPVEVKGIADAAEVATGDEFACARTKSGDVFCWGKNEDGELGDDSAKGSPTAKKVAGLSGVADIDAHDDIGCAVLKDGTVRCWGDNSELHEEPAKGPQAIPSVKGATQVAVGNEHACAVVEGGKLWCWGRSRYGQRGAGRSSDALPPKAVEGLNGVTLVAAADDGTCVISDNGRSAFCWGRVNDGRLGNGWQTEDLPLAEVEGVPLFEQAAVGDHYTCGLTKSGDLHCWGDAALHGCVDAPLLRSTPRKAATALKGRLVGYGAHPFVLGDPSAMITGDACHSVEPAKDDPTLSAVAMTGLGALRAVAGMHMVWALGGDGRIHAVALGDKAEGDKKEDGDAWTFKRVPLAGVNDATDLATSFGHVCVLRRNGKVSCFEETYADLDEVKVIEAKLVELPGIEGATQVVGAHSRGCIVDGDGQVSCWNGRPGQDGFKVHERADLGGKAKLVALGDAGKVEGCALLEDGTVTCWDDWATVTKMGQDRKTAPAKRLPVGKAKWVGIGQRHACVLLETGKLSCWGDNFSDALGRPNPPVALTPQKVQL
jgi:alpha-tubulin suppressor-like RCC1 family protein